MNTKACVTCLGDMSASDTHRECYSCRAKEQNCIECGRQFTGIRKKCNSCKSVKGNELKRDNRYGFTPGEYDAMFILQQGLCAICHRPEKAITRSGRSYKLVVDHDHGCCPGEKSCGKCVRGLICRNCNVLLGMAEDSIAVLRNAMNYILAFSSEREDQPSESPGMAQVGEEIHADISTISPNRRIDNA